MTDDNKTTPTPAQGLDLDAVEREVRDDEIDGMARTYAPALIAEVRALRERCRDAEDGLRSIAMLLGSSSACGPYAMSASAFDAVQSIIAKLAEAKRLGLEACQTAQALAAESGRPRDFGDHARTITIAAALEAL